MDDTYDYDFYYNDLGAITQTQVAAGATIVADTSYSPSGLLAGYEEYWVYGGSVIFGETMEYRFTPNAEMVGFANLSTNETWGYVYDLAGNMIAQGMQTESDTSDPIIEHIYLGNRIIVSVTGSGDACFIATVAYGSPLSKDLDVFRAFRDRVLKANGLGRRFVNSYYHGWGPAAAGWVGEHGTARGAARWALAGAAVPLKVALFGHWAALIFIFLCVLGVFVVVKKKAVSTRKAFIIASGLAIVMTIGYSYFVDVPSASASYTEGAKHYYTLDHIGRPMNLRDSSRTLSWYEQHYPFGDLINDETPNGDLTAGAGNYTVAWTPGFRFPGQFQDPSQSSLIHNHYREYIPSLGRYNRMDPLLSINITTYISFPILSYTYCNGSPFRYYDSLGLQGYDYQHPFWQDEGHRNPRKLCCTYREPPETCREKCRGAFDDGGIGEAICTLGGWYGAKGLKESLGVAAFCTSYWSTPRGLCWLHCSKFGNNLSCSERNDDCPCPDGSWPENWSQ